MLGDRVESAGRLPLCQRLIKEGFFRGSFRIRFVYLGRATQPIREQRERNCARSCRGASNIVVKTKNKRPRRSQTAVNASRMNHLADENLEENRSEARRDERDDKGSRKQKYFKIR